MSNAITITGSEYKITGTVKDKANNKGVVDLHVLAYDKDILKDDFLGIGVTDETGEFTIEVDASQFNHFFDSSPDLYFIVKDAGLELLNTKDNVISDADESTAAINMEVDMSEDKLRKLINKDPADGWVGGFAQSKKAFAYPNPILTSLDIEGNMDNIDKLDRQQKVLWPEFSWETEPDKEDTKRCYQMFAPDISRLGYTKEGQVFSIICPQQGACSTHLGCMNVEVTVTGNRGWADEANREIAADMGVEGRIWFSPSAHKHRTVKLFKKHFRKHKLPFPGDKDNAIVVQTFKPGNPDQPLFPLTKGPSPSEDFRIPDFARHDGIAWSLGHLGVEIGSIKPTKFKIVNDFNQLVLDIFNTASGNMLKEGNTLTWNVWFTAPELVNRVEWKTHAIKWRKSLNVDHASPDGSGTVPRYFDGTPFKPLNELIKDQLPKILAFIETHLKEKNT